MWNPKRLWRASAASTAALLGLHLTAPFGGTVAKSAGRDQRLPVPVLDETPRDSGTEILILPGGCFCDVKDATP